MPCTLEPYNLTTLQCITYSRFFVLSLLTCEQVYNLIIAMQTVIVLTLGEWIVDSTGQEFLVYI